jgi:hypothetical protein
MDPTVEAALIAAAATLVGVGGTVIMAVTSAQNARRTNQATIDAAYNNAQLALEVTREAQFADRYSRALEQIGSDNIDVRIGGIHALESTAITSPRHHPTVMEVLTAFVREHSRVPSDGVRPNRWPLPDVRAALTGPDEARTAHVTASTSAASPSTKHSEPGSSSATRPGGGPSPQMSRSWPISSVTG